MNRIECIIATVTGAVFFAGSAAAEEESLVSNGSFETMTGTVTEHSGLWQVFSDGLKPDGWSYEADGDIGFAKEGGTVWFTSTCLMPDGEWAVFFNQNGTISRNDIVVTEAGHYSVSLKYVSRGRDYVDGRFYIMIGDAAIGDPIDVGSDNTMFSYAERRAYLAPGTYTLKIRHSDENNIRTNNKGGACSAIDTVSIRKIDTGNLVLNGSFENSQGVVNDKGWAEFGSDEKLFPFGWTQSVDSLIGLTDSTNGVWFHSSTGIPDGRFALFMNRDGSVSQVIDVTESGMYIVGLDYISRGTPNARSHYENGLVYLELDGNQVGRPVDVGNVRTVFRTALWKLPLTAGPHTITIRHSDENNVRDETVFGETTGSGACSSIDAVFVRKTDKLILNGDFDYGTAVDETTWSYCDAATFSNPGWSQSGKAGLSKSGTPWVSPSLSTVGTYALFLQTANYSKRQLDDAAVWQSVDIDKAGMYDLTFSYAARPKYDGATLYVRVYKGEGTGGTKVWEDSVTATSADAFLQFDKEVKLDAAGSYTIEFYSPKPEYSESVSNDKAVILDNIDFEYAGRIPGFEVIVL